MDSRDLRARILKRLCDGRTQTEVRQEITREHGLTAGNAVITRVVRQVAAGRNELLRPGAYRPETTSRSRARSKGRVT